MESANEVLIHLQMVGDEEIASHSRRFFKSGPGEYGAGDQFLGIRVPALRTLVKQLTHLGDGDIIKLLYSDYHEARLLSVLLLVERYQKAKQPQRKQQLFDLYIEHCKQVNNWDLVDSSAHKIVGPELLNKSRALLYELANSENLWQRRIAIISTFFYIKRSDFVDCLAISEKLLRDEEDLIHKAVGWMLREMGKMDKQVEIQFLNQFYQQMPRTMLRYAIEKFTKEERHAYMTGQI